MTRRIFMKGWARECRLFYLLCAVLRGNLRVRGVNGSPPEISRKNHQICRINLVADDLLRIASRLYLEISRKLVEIGRKYPN